MAVNHEGVVLDLEAEFVGHGALTLLDLRIDEFLDVAAIDTENVIVVGPRIQFEDCHAVFEMMSRHEPRRLELRQHALHRRPAGVLAQHDEPTVDILGRHMPIDRRFENLEDFDARRGDLETRLAKIVAFHVAARPLR